MTSAHEFAGSFILAGFKGENPAESIGKGKARYLFEIAFEEYIQRHKMYVLCKIEEPTWTIFHTNVHGERLKKTREKYLERQDIERYMNAGFSEGEQIPEKALYYGQEPTKIGLLKKLRIAFGQSSIGPFWRALKQRLRFKY